jgi:hypothetical protein
MILTINYSAEWCLCIERGRGYPEFFRIPVAAIPGIGRRMRCRRRRVEIKPTQLASGKHIS